jgi:hypothetical protein
MWLQIGFVAGGLVAIAAVLRWTWRSRSSKRIEVGRVSDSWLAEERARRTDSQ